MKVAVGIGVVTHDWDEMSSFVIEAERLGVDSVWSAENWAHDAVSPLAYIAAKTSRIRLGTGIMQTVARTPAMIAMTAMTLQHMSGGRFILGLGASGPQVVEGWHGVRFTKTGERIREIADIVRMVSQGQRLSYHGEVFELPLPGGEGKALKTAAPITGPIPVYLATLSPKALRMTGEIADGWVGTSFIPEQAEVMFEHIRAGAAAAGRPFESLDLQVGGSVAFGDDLERMIAERKPGIAFTLGAMGSRAHNFYNAAYRRAGWEEVGKEVQALWLEGKRDEARMRVPDELVLASSLIGTEDMVLDRMRAYQAAGVTTLRIQPEGKTLAERLTTLGHAMELIKRLNEPATA